ncbi:hypothetical protein NDU88_005586 [Pleurodeles waltl]|uniref:Uncharacterized protein n=1 Tax=Pleurodeles waltl TaxID=8319 RepID=A0AAV7WVM9_PLEWA|nr:hypothetical protein NDU88_005586 [Pleurodeles waltl]
MKADQANMCRVFTVSNSSGLMGRNASRKAKLINEQTKGAFHTAVPSWERTSALASDDNAEEVVAEIETNVDGPGDAPGSSLDACATNDVHKGETESEVVIDHGALPNVTSPLQHNSAEDSLASTTV